MTSRRGGRPSQVRPRPPSTGRPAPAKVHPRAPVAGRAASHRRVERTRRLALPFRLLFAAAVLALGIGVLFVANGGVGRAADFLGSTLAGFVGSLVATPAPSTAPSVIARSPTLDTPAEPYTNQPTVDIVGRVPENLVGDRAYQIRIYVAIGAQPPGQVAELGIGDTTRFVVAGVVLSEGPNTFTATIVGPAGESDPSAGVAYTLDTAAPPIKLSAPKDGAVVNAKDVEVKGTTQARSALKLTNALTTGSVIGAADQTGAFSLIIAIGDGANPLSLEVTDPAGNTKSASLTVQKGSGSLTGRLDSSVSSVSAAKLPEAVQLSVVVTDPDGRPVANAQATFSLAANRVQIISRSTTTDATGRAALTFTIPRGAATGQCHVSVIVQTAEFGRTADSGVITIAN